MQMVVTIYSAKSQSIYCIQKRQQIPFKFTQYYAKWYTNACPVAAITPAHRIAHVLSNLATRTALSL